MEKCTEKTAKKERNKNVVKEKKRNTVYKEMISPSSQL